MQLHIIDDVNFIAFELPDSALKSVQLALWEELTAAGLTLKMSKTTALENVVRNQLPFIGYEWDILKHTLVARNERVQSVTSLANVAAGAIIALHERDFQPLIGKVFSIALGGDLCSPCSA